MSHAPGFFIDLFGRAFPVEFCEADEVVVPVDGTSAELAVDTRVSGVLVTAFSEVFFGGAFFEFEPVDM